MSDQPAPTADTGDITVIDAHQWALLVGIDLEGVAHVMSSRVDRPEAARLLRLLADRFEATHTPAGEPR